MRKIFNAVIIINLVMTVGLTCLLGEEGQKNQRLPTNPIEGRIVLEEKGCINCHAIDGFGGDIGPDLVREKYYGSRPNKRSNNRDRGWYRNEEQPESGNFSVAKAGH